MATQTTPVVKNISISNKAKIANAAMAANKPIQKPDPSKPGL